VHEAHRHAARRGGERARYGGREGEGEAVVADPVLEEVAEDVERVGAGRRVAQEPLESRDDRGAGRV
jgi:hypothetical protein